MLTNKEKIFVSAIVYIHNKQKYVYQFLAAVNHQLGQNFERYEIICINDASTDKSVQEIQRYSSDFFHCEISIVNMGYYQGLESSMIAGIDLSIGDFVFEFDSVIMDYKPDLLMDIYRHSLTGFDIVSAAPNQYPSPFSQLFYLILNNFSNTQYIIRPDVLRVMSRRAVNRVHGISGYIPYRKAIYANCGLKADTITYHSNITVETKEQAEKNKIMETAIDAAILYTNLAYRCSITLSMLMIATALFIGIYTLIVYISGHPVAGWTTTMLFLACAFGGLFVLLTIVIKYISLILKLIFSKKRYLVESVVKTGNQQ